MKLSQLGKTLSSTVNSETKSFKDAYSHPELDGAYAGAKSDGEIIVPVSGPNPAIKVEPGPTVSGPTGPREPDFQFSKSYMASGNMEFQGKPMTDVPLNSLSRDPAPIQKV